MNAYQLSPRAYGQVSIASSWEEIWEAGPYYDRISDLLENAQEYAIFVGWQIDSRLPLKRPNHNKIPSISNPRTESLREKVIRICEEKPLLRIYFLVWDHAYFYVLERENWQGRIWEDVHPHVYFVFDNRHPFGASHHEKVTIVDGEIALCGGIDLCDERWDTPIHQYDDPRRSLNGEKEKHGPYHDMAVQVTGPICSLIQEHVAKRWRVLSSIPFPNPRRASELIQSSNNHRVYLSRTLAQIEHPPKQTEVIREVEFLFRDLIQNAENRIILEGQYYWSNIVNDMLISKIHQMKGKKFEVILVLAQLQWIKSLTRYMTGYELSLIQKLKTAADYSGVKLTVGSPYVFSSARGTVPPPKPVYIHSKVLVVDDRFLSIGTANFATRALRLDTEIALTLEAVDDAEKKHIQDFSKKLLQHWGIEPGEGQHHIVIREFKPDLELIHLRKSLDRTRIIPWQSLFDPAIAWFFPLKARFRRLVQGDAFTFISTWICIYSVGLIAVWTFSKFWNISGISVHLLCSLLVSVWILPVPYILTTILMMLHVGTVAGGQLSVLSLWIASILGYSVARAFPVTSGWFYSMGVPKRLFDQMGLRRFSSLVSVLFDPRVGIRLKIGIQGLYCTPFPWFLLGTLVVLPATVYLISYWSTVLAVFLLPDLWIEFIRNHAKLIAFGLLLLSMGKASIKLWKNVN